jgi:hypothetical protein
VEKVETRELLRDLRQPHSQLIATVGENGLHIFDQTHKVWIYTNAPEVEQED